MRLKEINHPVQADTYEASMALNQLLKIGQHAIKLHNLIKDEQEMESWVAKKIDLAGDYVKKVHGYTMGQKAGFYEDAGSLTDQQKQGLQAVHNKFKGRVTSAGGSLPYEYLNYEIEPELYSDMIDSQEEDKAAKAFGYDSLEDVQRAMDDGEIEGDYPEDIEKYIPITMTAWAAVDSVLKGANDEQRKAARDYLLSISESAVKEDAGEGHMSKSTLYHTAKYAIELMQMIKKGDDLEGWVQSKLNKAADYLQGAYNYEEYQKLSPYREDLDGSTFAKHKEIIKKNIDEILAKETDLDDTDTKPGMMRILNKRVNEVEKKMSQQKRKDPEDNEEEDDVLPKDFDDQPRDRGQRIDVGEKHGGDHSTSGRSMTKGEMNKREKIVKAMKKDKAGFKKRYGKDAEAVMYATATKQAMGEDKYEFRGNPFPILGKAESYLNYGSDMAKAIINKDDRMTAMAQTYLDRIPSFVNTEMKEIFPKTENVKEYADKPRQLKDPSKEVMMQKGGKVIVVDKDKEKEYMAKGYQLAETLDEDMKGFLQKLAAAGIIVGTMAGAGSLLNALDNSVPAMKAMNTAYDMATDAGNEELAKMIKNDISAVKVRLSSGKDLNFVKAMQDKYSKFMPTEGLAYESKLAVLLNQQLK